MKKSQQPKTPAPVAVDAWTEPKYPGDTVRIAAFFRNREVGDVRIQWYGETSVRVGTFLPGVDVVLPGDTPKTEPERAEWCHSRDAADTFFETFCKQAIEEGWTFHAGGYRAIFSNAGIEERKTALWRQRAKECIPESESGDGLSLLTDTEEKALLDNIVEAMKWAQTH